MHTSQEKPVAAGIRVLGCTVWCILGLELKSRVLELVLGFRVPGWRTKELDFVCR